MMMHDGPARSDAELLIVCTGNVCRSPYLERRLRHELAAGWPALAERPDGVGSAGTRALVGRDMDPYSRELLAARQGDPGPFEARQLEASMTRAARLIVTMTRSQRTAVARLEPRSMRKTYPLLDLAALIPHLPASAPGPAAASGRGTWAERLDAVSAGLANLRGTVPPPAEDRSAVLDPIGRDRSAFAAMAAQIEATIPQLRYLLSPTAAAAPTNPR